MSCPAETLILVNPETGEIVVGKFSIIHYLKSNGITAGAKGRSWMDDNNIEAYRCRRPIMLENGTWNADDLVSDLLKNRYKGEFHELTFDDLLNLLEATI